jgi:D-aminopeptidase
MARPRLRDLGLAVGRLPPGPLNAITDVTGVRVGHATIVADAPHTVRTGVTAIWPRGPEIWDNFVFAGGHSFNGNGEMTGLVWIAEQGLLASPIAITNTHAVGVIRDAVCAYAIRAGARQSFHLPVVAETSDAWLSDAAAFAVTQEHAWAALDGAVAGPVAEGNIGGGTGMICHEFKGGIGTASRRVGVAGRPYCVGALVQANYGIRELLRVDGVPVGREIDRHAVPSARGLAVDAGSIIVILATDAPLLPIQCQRLARRATTGLAWAGGFGANGSGDIFLAFSTGNSVPMDDVLVDVVMLGADATTPLFEAAAEATEEAILNALVAAETMTGQLGRVAPALPHDRLIAAMRRYRRID